MNWLTGFRWDDGRRRVVGSLLLAQFCFVAFVKWRTGAVEQLLWVSHAGLLLSAFGLLSGRLRWAATALIMVLLPHAVWVGDWMFTLFLPGRLFGVTEYLQQAGIWDELATLHHFFLAPALLCCVPIETRRSGFSLLGATAAFFVLTCMAHAVSGPSSNINYAFYIPDTLSGTSATVLNNIDRRWYLLALNACACACCFLPAWGLLRVVDRMIASNLGSDRAEGQTLGRA